MPTPSRLDDVIAALVVMFGAVGTTYDGPTPTSIDAEGILVGSDGDLSNADSDAATVAREWSPLGNRWVEETGDVVCSAWSTSGDDDIAARRARVFVLLAGCEAALLADPTLGGLLVGAGITELPQAALRQWQTSQGCGVRVVFIVRYQALLN